MGRNNIIELNGKKYDAASGALLGEAKIKVTPASSMGHLARQGRVVDDFIRPSGVKPSNVVKEATKVQPIKQSNLDSKAQSAKHFDIQRASGPKPLKAHQPERPKTLMRHVVSKPKTTIKPAIKTTVPSEMTARPADTLAKPLEKKMSVTQVNPIRMARSKHVAKSHHIRRYHAQKSPQQSSVPSIISNTVRPNQYANRPVANRSNFAAQSQAPINSTEQKTNHIDVFEAALAHATSHQQKTPKDAHRHSVRHRRFVNIMAGVGAFLLLAGFIGYLNLPAMELRIASMRAGFHAQMPSYKPPGFALAGDIESGEGKIAISFRSGDSSYKVTQESSDWNSTTLLDQNTADRGTPSQTIQSKGRTIYIYDDTSATWVNGGIRYEISGNATLDADELVSLATSM